MTDRTRPTLRLRLPVTPPGPDGMRTGGPAGTAPPLPRPTAYVPPPSPRPMLSARPMAPARLEASSRAILEELAALGLADAPEP